MSIDIFANIKNFKMPTPFVFHGYISDHIRHNDVLVTKNRDHTDWNKVLAMGLEKSNATVSLPCTWCGSLLVREESYINVLLVLREIGWHMETALSWKSFQTPEENYTLNKKSVN